MWQFDDSASTAADESVSWKKDNTIEQTITFETSNS